MGVGPAIIVNVFHEDVSIIRHDSQKAGFSGIGTNLVVCKGMGPFRCFARWTGR